MVCEATSASVALSAAQNCNGLSTSGASTTVSTWIVVSVLAAQLPNHMMPKRLRVASVSVGHRFKRA